MAKGISRYNQREAWLQQAKENTERDGQHYLETQCRAAARWLQIPEENWRDLETLIHTIEAGRQEAEKTRVWSKEEMDSWRNYMMNR